MPANQMEYFETSQDASIAAALSIHTCAARPMLTPAVRVGPSAASHASLRSMTRRTGLMPHAHPRALKARSFSKSALKEKPRTTTSGERKAAHRAASTVSDAGRHRQSRSTSHTSGLSPDASFELCEDGIAS
eukprot:6212570-Pleurochrysis_carterae.AAC.6